MLRILARILFLGAAVLLGPACEKSKPVETPNQNPGPGPGPGPAAPKVLVFVAYNRVWWAEYKVAVEALQASGYDVDVRSSGTGSATSYQTDGDVQTSADSLAGSGYAAFTASYAATLGTAWDPAWNTPAPIPIAGRLQDVASLADYRAIAIIGGIGAVDYRYDGTYADTVDGAHVGTAAEVQAAATKLNDLVLEAFQAGKPVLAECHGATLPIFARVPGSAGQMPAPDALGRSLLQGRGMTGFPLGSGDTAAACAAFGVTYLADRVTAVDGPSAANLAGSDLGTSRLITSRDWYPQTVLHAVRTLTVLLESYPAPAALSTAVSVLILHGGPVDPANPSNDIPANYGMAPASMIPVDYLDLAALFNANSPGDPFSIAVTDVNLVAGPVPFNPNDAASSLAYFSAFDAVLVFKHWSTNFPDALQNGLKSYADAGGGVVALHHALYNQQAGAASKNILCRDLFGVESAGATWSARNPGNGPYAMLSMNYGHFVSTYGVAYAASATLPPAATPASPLSPNPSAAGYPTLSIVDEIYNNMAFTGAPSFGGGIGQIRPLFANDYAAQPGQMPASGFTKRFDGNGDGTAGRLVFLQPGERVENFVVGSPWAQVVRNAVVWAAQRD